MANCTVLGANNYERSHIVRKKRLLHIALSIVFSSMCIVPCFASYGLENAEYRTQRGLVVNNDIPYEQIEAIHPVMVAQLLEEGGPIEAADTQTHYFSENTDGIQLASLEPTEFNISVVAQRNSEKGPNYDSYTFSACGYWVDPPGCQMEDVIAMAWSDDFTLYDDYAYEIRSSQHIYNPPTLTRHTVNAEIGLSYSYNFSMLPLGVDTEFIFLIAKVYKLNDIGSANVTAEYAHATKSTSVGVSFSIPAGISFSPTINNSIETAVPAYTYFDY